MSYMGEPNEEQDWDDSNECEQWHWEYQAFLDYLDECNERIQEAKEKDHGEL